MASTGGKIIAGSFWLIMAIHVAVFASVGFATKEWRLMIIFVIGFVLFMAVYGGLKVYFAKHPEKKEAMLKLPLIRNVRKKGK